MTTAVAYRNRWRLTPEELEAATRIAAELGGTVCEYSDPRGNDYRRWIEVPNRGFPFDRNIERDILRAIRTAGWVW